ncbi:MAG: type II secretion system protein [Phycisphaerales bacterium]|jgi:prepilin-type processing-associated H-X9-DG protein
MKQINKLHSGFSLVEILVVVSTSALLVGLLIPSLQMVRQQAQRSFCLNNLRQMALAAQTYSTVYDDHYPIAYHTERINGIRHYLAWDFNTWKDWSQADPIEHVEPGILWMGQMIEKIQQCPVFKGPANWLVDPCTGYNYNTSYIGRDETVDPVSSARTNGVRCPGQTVLFGDGEYSGGANKFMRAPFSNPRDASFSDTFRHAGVQGFRHLHTTNVAFCDGHADFFQKVHINTDPYSRDILEEHNRTHQNKIGFLSEDNRLYDLE